MAQVAGNKILRIIEHEWQSAAASSSFAQFTLDSDHLGGETIDPSIGGRCVKQYRREDGGNGHRV